MLGTLISDWDFDILGYGYYVLINFFQDRRRWRRIWADSGLLRISRRRRSFVK